jgi:hypothetical protein
MRTGILMAAAVALAAIVGWVGHGHDPAPRAPTAVPRPGALGDAFDLDEPATADQVPALRGRASEVIDVAEYTYLRLSTTQGEVWAAVSKAPVAVGSDVAVENPTRMENFESATLKRTFPVIYFGALQSAGAAADDDRALPPGHPSIDGEAGPVHAHGGPAPAETADLTDVKVSRAAGGNARTVGELFAEGVKLEGKLLRVRGQVVKVTPGVLGKTYLRLRDGSGARPEERELVVTTQVDARVGDVTTFEGTLRSQVDVGIGYKYPVLLDDAKLVAEPATPAL